MPTDERDFSEKMIPKLRKAAEEVYFLLNRGYPVTSTTRFIGDHYQLSERQRLALARTVSPEESIRSRKSREVTDIAGKTLYIDGFNVIIGLEIAYSDSMLFCCMDGTWCFAASTAGLSFFSRRNRTSPELVKQVDEADEIRTLFYNNEYVCVVLNNSASAERYRLEVYKPDGSQVLSKEFSMNYSAASVSGDYVFLFSSNEAMIVNMAGTEKFHGGEFIMAGTSNVKGVRLR